MVDLPDWDLRLGYLIHDVSRLRRMMFDRALAPLGKFDRVSHVVVERKFGQCCLRIKVLSIQANESLRLASVLLIRRRTHWLRRARRQL